MAHKYVKRHYTSLIVGEIQIKTIINISTYPPEIAKNKQTTTPTVKVSGKYME